MASPNSSRNAVTLNLWIWWNEIFNWWALIFALLLFFPLGVATGYNVRQPSLVMASARELLTEIQDSKGFFLQAEASQPRDIDDKAKKLDQAVTKARDALASLPKSGQARLQDRMGEVVAASDDLEKSLRKQNIDYDRNLNTDLSKLNKIHTSVRAQIEASSSLPSILYEQLARFMKWIGALSFLTIVAITLFIIALSNPRFRKIIARTGSISAFGISLNLTDLQSVRMSIQVRQKDIETDVKAVYTRALRNSKLATLFQKSMKDIEAKFANIGVDLTKINYRATLFVPGFIGQELVQATRYFGTWKIGDDSVIGRRFSLRFGIIGRSWRLQTCQYYPEIENTNKNLVRNWGFTQDEAKPFIQAGANTPSGSLMAFPIKDIGDAPPLGLIYIEAEGANHLHPASSRTGLSSDVLLADGSGMTTADQFARDSIWSKFDAALLEKLVIQLNRLQAVMRWNDKVQEGAGR